MAAGYRHAWDRDAPEEGGQTGHPRQGRCFPYDTLHWEDLPTVPA